MSQYTTALYCPWCGTIYALEPINTSTVDKYNFTTEEICNFCGDVPLLFLCFMPGAFRLRNVTGNEKNFD